MPHRIASWSFGIMWILGGAIAVGAARYFLPDPPLLFLAQLAALARHPTWFLLHVGCGIVAIAIGPLQFLARLRASRPKLHRAIGYVYLVAVFLGASAAMRLARDTASFTADALNDTRYLEQLGISREAGGFVSNVHYDPSQFDLVVAAFAGLSVSWLVTSAMALLRARQRRFDAHRAWMIRSYSLTFAAATVRLTGLPLLLMIRNPLPAITLSYWMWVFNLVIAEWIVRRERVSAPAGVRRELRVTG